MKAKFSDILLSCCCISLLTGLALGTTAVLSLDFQYEIVLDVLVFLLTYGLYTALLLSILRRFFPYPIGSYSLDSKEFAYWKLVSMLVNLAEKSLSPFSNVFTQPLVYALLGAQIGKNTAMAGTLRDLPLLIFEEGSVAGQNSTVFAHAISDNTRIDLRPIRIGKGAIIGANCVVMPGVTLGHHAVLASGAVAVSGTAIPAEEVWGGIPARKIKTLNLKP